MRSTAAVTRRKSAELLEHDAMNHEDGLFAPDGTIPLSSEDNFSEWTRAAEIRSERLRSRIDSAFLLSDYRMKHEAKNETKCIRATAGELLIFLDSSPLPSKLMQADRVANLVFGRFR